MPEELLLPYFEAARMWRRLPVGSGRGTRAVGGCSNTQRGGDRAGGVERGDGVAGVVRAAEGEPSRGGQRLRIDRVVVLRARIQPLVGAADSV
jgi:hypothetical protein